MVFDDEENGDGDGDDEGNESEDEEDELWEVEKDENMNMLVDDYMDVDDDVMKVDWMVYQLLHLDIIGPIQNITALDNTCSPPPLILLYLCNATTTVLTEIWLIEKAYINLMLQA